MALLGPNGAGKTTVLRALAGLPADRRRHGSTIDGAVVDDPDSRTFVPPEHRPVGVVFQDHLLFPHLTVARERGLRAPVVAARRRPTARAQAQRVARAGRASATWPASRPRRISGGQAQRVALARALAAEPRLLLLDEPLAALDAGTRATVRRDLRRHLDDFDGVTVLVTHDPLDALALADRVVILEDGAITQSRHASPRSPPDPGRATSPTSSA